MSNPPEIRESFVLDVGSSSLKCGYSGQETPTAIFPSVSSQSAANSTIDEYSKGKEIGNQDSQFPAVLLDKPRRPNAIDFDPFCPSFFTDKKIDDSALSTIDIVGKNDVEEDLFFHPVQRGEIVDFEEYEKLLHFTFEKELYTNIEEISIPVVISESPSTTKKERSKVAEILFEKFHVPALSFVNSATLNLFCSGRVNGISVDVGGGVSHVVPIFEGFALPHATVRMECAGQDITQNLKHILASRGLPISSDTARDLKEKFSLCSLEKDAKKLDPWLFSTLEPHMQQADYELPDGKIITLSDHERSNCLEILFDNQYNSRSLHNTNSSQGDKKGETDAALADFSSSNQIGASTDIYKRDKEDKLAFHKKLGYTKTVHRGLGESTAACLSMCDLDLQPMLQKNFVVGGAISTIPGFVDRYHQEVMRCVPNAINKDIRVANTRYNREPGANWQRKYASWIGGSIFSTLDTFKEVIVTQQEWEDSHGIEVNRKAV